MKQTDRLMEKALRIEKVQMSLANSLDYDSSDLDIRYYNKREKRISRILKKLDKFGSEYRQQFIDRIYF